MTGIGWVDADEWYLPTTDGAAQLYVREVGTGPLVVVLHGGWGHDHEYLLDAVAGIETNYRFVLYDQRGSLRSPCALDAITFEAHVEDLELLRAALGMERMSILGHSMGTFLAMSYLARHPDRTAGLVLAGCVSPRMPPTPEENGIAAAQRTAADDFMNRPAVRAQLEEEGLAKEGLSAKEATYAWRIRFTAANCYHVDRWRQMRGGMVFYNDAVGEAAGKTAPKTFDYLGPMSEHDHPVSVILGDHDFQDIGARYARLRFEGVPNIDLTVIPEAGHNIWIDQPKTWREALGNALARAVATT